MEIHGICYLIFELRGFMFPRLEVLSLLVIQIDGFDPYEEHMNR